MNVGAHRSWFIGGSLVLMLLAATPTLALFIHVPNSSEKFSELWLLGPGHKAEDYPFNVKVNQTYGVYVGVGNHLGYSAYYRILVKFRNQTQPLPTNVTSSPLPPLYEFGFFSRDGETWEKPLNFKITKAYSSVEFMNVSELSINGVAFALNGFSEKNTAENGFYYQLFFELWLFNTTSQDYQFHNRHVRIWMNVTSV